MRWALRRAGFHLTEIGEGPGHYPRPRTGPSISSMLLSRRASWYRSWPSPILGDLSYDVTFTTIYKLLPSCEVVPYFRGILAPNFVMSSLLLGGRRKDRQYPVAPLTTPPTGPRWQNRVPSLHLQGKSRPGRASPTMAAASVSVCEAAEVRPFFEFMAN